MPSFDPNASPPEPVRLPGRKPGRFLDVRTGRSRLNAMGHEVIEAARDRVLVSLNDRDDLALDLDSARALLTAVSDAVEYLEAAIAYDARPKVGDVVRISEKTKPCGGLRGVVKSVDAGLGCVTVLVPGKGTFLCVTEEVERIASLDEVGA